MRQNLIYAFVVQYVWWRLLVPQAKYGTSLEKDVSLLHPPAMPIFPVSAW
jgi:hypothetical protein